MKVKNLNPVERHVEKIVLGVAVLAAAYMGYVGMDHATITPPGAREPLTPQAVEDEIKKAITSVDSKAQQTRQLWENGRNNRRTNAIVLDDMPFLRNYRALVEAPMPAWLTQMAVRAMPLQYSPSQLPVDTQPDRKVQYALGAPIPTIYDQKADVGRGTIQPPAPPPVPGTPAGTPAAPLPEPRDATIVRISGAFSMRDLREAIANIKNPKQALPPNLQVVVLKGLEVERIEQNPDGSWPKDEAAWKPVPPLEFIPPAPQIPVEQFPSEQLKPDQALRPILEYMPISLQPPMYAQPAPTAHAGGTEVKPPAEFFPALAPATQPGAATATAPKGPVRGPAVPVAPVRPVMPPPGDFVEEGGGPEFFPTPSTPTIVGTANVGTILSSDAIRVWAYDETVKPEHNYRYRMRIKFFNPLFKFPQPEKFLANKADADKPWINTKWVEIEKPVHIEPDMFFFVMGNGQIGGAGRDTVDVQIFNFARGSWHMAQANGLGVGVPVSAGPTSTGYTIIDIIPAGRDATTVLLNPVGQLVTRSYLADLNSQRRRDLEREAKGPPATRPIKPGVPGGPPRGAAGAGGGVPAGVINAIKGRGGVIGPDER